MQKNAQTKKYGFFSLFNFRDTLAKGRSCMLLSASMSSMITYLSGGLFYTSFLTKNGINIVEIGILSFIPYIANCFSMFSPSILERFKKRKGILALSRLLYYTLLLLGVTVMPYLVHDQSLKMTLFLVIVFAANIINALFTSGYTAWHLNFIPDDAVRAEYFAMQTLIGAVLGCGTSLAASVAADALSGSAYEETVIVLLRFLALAIGIIDVLVLSAPKEFPYESDNNGPRFKDIFVKSLTCKPFAITMLILGINQFFYNVPISVRDYFLLNTVGVEYTLISIADAFYPVFLFLFLPFWKRILYRIGWFRTFALGSVLHVPTILLYSCINENNYMWLLLTVRLSQHFFGVGRNLACANLGYVNMPTADRTNYVSFNTFIVNAAVFLGMMAGTGFVSLFPELSLNIFGMRFCNVQVLMWVEAFGSFLVPFMVMKLLPKIEHPSVTN